MVDFNDLSALIYMDNIGRNALFDCVLRLLNVRGMIYSLIMLQSRIIEKILIAIRNYLNNLPSDTQNSINLFVLNCFNSICETFIMQSVCK